MLGFKCSKFTVFFYLKQECGNDTKPGFFLLQGFAIFFYQKSMYDGQYSTHPPPDHRRPKLSNLNPTYSHKCAFYQKDFVTTDQCELKLLTQNQTCQCLWTEPKNNTKFCLPINYALNMIISALIGPRKLKVLTETFVYFY